MKCEIDFSPLPDYVLMKYEGKASSEGFDNALKTLVSSPQWKIGTKQLVDHRKANFKDFSSDDMKRVVNIVKKHHEKLGNGPCAFVVKGDFGFGLARMYEILGGDGIHVQIGIFHSIDEAIGWLKDR